MTGFTQYGKLLLMQLASVTGMIGITFLMGWFASVTNWAWENRAQGSQVRRGLAAFGAVFAAVSIFGTLRLNLAHMTQAGETVRVAGITVRSQSTLGKRGSEVTEVAVLSHWNAYFAETVSEAQAGAQVIVWPEGAGLTFKLEETATLVAQAQEVARQNEIYLVIGYGIIYSDGGKPW